MQTAEQIDAEIEALRMRIRRLRIERKVAALSEAETRLMQLAKTPVPAEAPEVSRAN